jgi:hypothetical protein
MQAAVNWFGKAEFTLRLREGVTQQQQHRLPGIAYICCGEVINFIAAV